jgi:hypothetical protein
MVALGSDLDADWARIGGCLLAVLAALFATLAFRPNDLHTLKPARMRDHCLNMSPSDAMLKSLDTLLLHIDYNEAKQRNKVRLMKLSVWTLVLAAAILGAGAVAGPST